MADTDPDSIKSLAFSVASLTLLMASSRFSLRGMGVLSLDSCADAARWAAVVTLLAGAYYLQYTVWRSCYRRRHHSGPSVAYSDVPQAPRLSEALHSAGCQRLTAEHVYVYVYGWGVLLFASLYCMTGLHESSSCWWALGMLPLCFDELVTRETRRVWVSAIILLLCCSMVFVWWGASAESVKDENLGLIVLRTIIPTMTPFIFFSLRSSARAVTQDIWRLCELALPFMILISICILTGSYMPAGERWRDGRGRRAARNGTLAVHYQETQSNFNGSPQPEGVRDRDWEGVVAHHLYLFSILALAPVVAAWCIHVLVKSVVRGHATEFLAAFLLVLSVKSSVSSEHPETSIVAIASSGVCFTLIFLMRKIA